MAIIKRLVKHGVVASEKDKAQVPLLYCFDDDYFVLRIEPTTDDSVGYAKITLNRERCQQLIKLFNDFIGPKTTAPAKWEDIGKNYKTITGLAFGVIKHDDHLTIQQPTIRCDRPTTKEPSTISRHSYEEVCKKVKNIILNKPSDLKKVPLNVDIDRNTSYVFSIIKGNRHE